MNCREFQLQLQTWLAGKTDEATDRALELHLSHCNNCLALLERDNSTSQNDLQLHAALAEPDAAARVAERALAEVAKTPSTAQPPQSIFWGTWLTPLLTLVAGFLLALFIFPPQAEKKNPVLPIAQPPAPPIPVAHLVAATGTVEMFDEQLKNWVPISFDKVKSFACATDSRVRTTADVRCELQTEDGCVIRLNDQTEVTLRGSSSIELCQGQVWCRSPRETQLEVRVANIAERQQKKAEQPTMWCVGPSCVMTGIQPAGQVQVVNAEGEINLRTAAGEQRLNPGQVAEISGGEIKPAHVDPVMSTRWMQPLLMQRGPDDAELKQRVDTLLAQIGQTKIATLYEQEIRSLGEYGVLPLVRFIQSPLGEKDPARRAAAMEIVADLAPVWLIPDLIDLLENPDPMVRRQAAETLQRLTALKMNLSPSAWQEKPDDDQLKALGEWRGWWAAHRDRYPKPQLRITTE